ncbi:hypothetical protein [Terasakiella pusilla]|uniref:hypothetical protein n=1 Tax=Terasakiella pusilla TaxID=64973 RepID=UPI003AA7FD25
MNGFDEMVDAICLQRGIDPNAESPMKMEDSACGRLKWATPVMDQLNWVIVGKELRDGLKELTSQNQTN